MREAAAPLARFAFANSIAGAKAERKNESDKRKHDKCCCHGRIPGVHSYAIRQPESRFDYDSAKSLPLRPQGPYCPDMPGGPPRNFSCPECGAFYKLVRVPRPESGEPQYQPIFCVNCNNPLPPKDNGFLLKYLMVGRPYDEHRHDSAPQTL